MLGENCPYTNENWPKTLANSHKSCDTHPTVVIHTLSKTGFKKRSHVCLDVTCK
jgi:hypothetical protein